MFVRKNQYVEKDGFFELHIESKHGWFITRFDKDDIHLVRSRQWHITIKKNKVYVLGGNQKDGVMYLHDLIIGQQKQTGCEVDHIDGDSLNNRRANLRIVPRIVNIQNSRTRIDNTTSGVRGVSYCSAYDTWKCDFNHCGVRYGGITFKTMAEAVYMRMCFESAFGLDICKRNPIAQAALSTFNGDSLAIEKLTFKRINEKRSAANTTKVAV